MDLLLAFAAGATLVPGLSALILNAFSPGAPVKRLAWLAATVVPALMTFYILRFIAGQVSAFGLLALMATPFWYAFGALAVGVSLAVGYLVSLAVITSLRRR